MKRLFALVFVTLAACQGSSKEATGAAAVDAAYKADFEALCDVINRSGTAELEPNERAMKIAAWLGSNLKTQDGRKFLSKMRPLQGTAKADLLDEEARRLGLSGCPLAAEWRKPHG